MRLAGSRDVLEGSVLQERYRLDHLLGEGGMAVVFAGYDLQLNRPVAIKVLRPQYASDAGFVARFQQEARLAAGLSAHPHIVTIYDVGHEGELHFIVMELVVGCTLKEVIRERGAMDVSATLTLGREMCAALAYAHRHGVIHRDVKPQNILLGGDGGAKITDFGIAWAATSLQLTLPGTVLGSADYMAPEQAWGRPVTPRSDVYSLGLVLFETLTGDLPWTEQDLADRQAWYARGSVPSPRDLNPLVPEEVSAGIEKALRTDPAERYPSAEAFSEALERSRRQTTTPAPLVDAPPQPTDIFTISPPARSALSAWLSGRRLGYLVRSSQPVGSHDRSFRPRWWVVVTGLLGLAGVAYAGAHAGSLAPSMGASIHHAAASTAGSGKGAPRSRATTQSPRAATAHSSGSHSAAATATLAVRPLAGVAVPTLRVDGAGFQPGADVTLRLSWRTTGNRPEPGYRWYQELQTVHAGPTGAFGGLMTLPVSPRAFASSTVSVIVSDGHTGQTLARAMSAISLPAPPPSPAPAPPSPVQGHDKKPKPDHGKHHGDEGD